MRTNPSTGPAGRLVRGLAVAVLSLVVLVLAAGAWAASDSTEALWRTSDEGSVAVEAIFRIPPEVKSGKVPQALVFEIWLTTHSGDLTKLDLAALSAVRTDRGEAAKDALRWELVRRSSHHPVGRLIVANQAAGDGQLFDAGSRFIELRLRNLGGVAERVLRWELKASP